MPGSPEASHLAQSDPPPTPEIFLGKLMLSGSLEDQREPPNVLGKCSISLQSRGIFRKVVRLWILQNLEGKNIGGKCV